MRHTVIIFGALATLCFGVAAGSRAQERSYSTLAPEAGGSVDAQRVDGIAARIEDDILTDSELRELAEFQKLVDGKAKPRDVLIGELTDQWIVRGEAESIKYPQPTPADVDRAYAQLARQYRSVEEFKKECLAAGLSELTVRRLLQEQLYLARFLDYRFRAAVQITDEQISAYYENEFLPQLKARGEKIPALGDVSDTIREVLVQREISDRSTKWLADARQRMRIDVLPSGEAP
jgi:hypothetical protein